MKIMKCTLSTVLAILMIFSLSMTSPSLAAAPSSNSSLSLQIPVQVEAIYADNTLSDEQIIKSLIELLFDAKLDQYENPTNEFFDFSIFWNVKSKNSNNLHYFERSIDAQKKLFSTFETYASNGDTTLTFFDITIANNTATVNLYEWFTYTYKHIDGTILDAGNGRSGFGNNYIITLLLTDGRWKIDNIVFVNTPTEVLRNEHISVESFVTDKYYEAITVTPSVLQAENLFDPTKAEFRNSYSYRTLNTTDVKNYALQYGGSNRNYAFPVFSANCQSFASQSIWYGLGGATSGGSAVYGIPMITPVLTTDSTRQWYSSIANGTSLSWSYVPTFASYVFSGTSSTYGLYGAIYSGYANAQVGDILQIDFDYGNSFDHTYVIVGVSGTAGSRTKSDIWVSAHTSDVNNVNLQLLDSGTFRIIRITGETTPYVDYIKKAGDYVE